MEDHFDEKGKYINKSKGSIFNRFKLDSTDLFRAIDKNNPDEVDHALRAGVKPNEMDGMDRLALPFAIDGNNPVIIRLLLNAKADPNKADTTGETPLYKAVSWANGIIVKMLLEAGADPNKANITGETPLQLARKKGFDTLEQMFAKSDAEAKAKRIAKEQATHEAMKAKAIAAKKEKELETKEALKTKVAQKGKQIERRAELMDDLKKVQQPVTEKIIPPVVPVDLSTAKETPPAPATTPSVNFEEKYKVVKGQYLAPLLKAVQDKDTPAVVHFTDQLADINAYDETLKTAPLLAALAQENTKLAKFFIDKGADPFAVIPQKGMSAIAMAVSLGQDDLVDFILDKKGDKVAEYLNDKNVDKNLLHYAVADPKMFAKLLAKGADPTYGGTAVPSPIELAISGGPIALLPALVAKKVDINQRINNHTLLEWAIHYDRQNWVVGLLQEDANTDTVNEQGETPLMMAIRSNKPEIVNLLLEDGADKTLVNKAGQTALQIAKKLGDRDAIIKVLS